MCQLEHNFLCRLCPFEEKCEEEREAYRKMEEMGE